MHKVIATLKRIADSEATILITGETGTGKSMLSGTVHFNSRRRTKPFIKINCANIPETLLESELFGHERGAFTGATKTRTGRLEQANEGTVFLDEIGELTPSPAGKTAAGTRGKMLRAAWRKPDHSDRHSHNRRNT